MDFFSIEDQWTKELLNPEHIRFSKREIKDLKACITILSHSSPGQIEYKIGLEILNLYKKRLLTFRIKTTSVYCPDTIVVLQAKELFSDDDLYNYNKSYINSTSLFTFLKLVINGNSNDNINTRNL